MSSYVGIRCDDCGKVFPGTDYGHNFVEEMPARDSALRHGWAARGSAIEPMGVLDSCPVCADKQDEATMEGGRDG